MNKDYPRDCLKMFDVFENGKVVFIGTAKEIGDFLGIKDRSVIEASKANYTVQGKYRIKFRCYRCFAFEIESIQTNEKFIGTAQDIADKLFLVDKGYVVRTAKKSKLLCGEWKIRFLDWMIETV